MPLDLDGLQVAYLGVALAHYLDLETGDIVDIPLDAAAPGDESRFLRIPTRTPESEDEDRRLFVEKLELSVMKDRLARLVDDPGGFRAAISEDLRVQRQFFNFKNDQATKAISSWIEAEGLS
ncbi:MAG TPA: hypothetical protein VEU30_05595 [Thermoanaerobaculia bacterium]|nr:hypothetical protein [Thermoanaerobaculia bacterium]